MRTISFLFDFVSACAVGVFIALSTIMGIMMINMLARMVEGYR